MTNASGVRHQFPGVVRLEWAQSRGRQAVLDIRFLGRLAGRHRSELGRERQVFAHGLAGGLTGVLSVPSARRRPGGGSNCPRTVGIVPGVWHHCDQAFGVTPWNEQNSRLRGADREQASDFPGCEVGEPGPRWVVLRQCAFGRASLIPDIRLIAGIDRAWPRRAARFPLAGP